MSAHKIRILADFTSRDLILIFFYSLKLILTHWPTNLDSVPDLLCVHFIVWRQKGFHTSLTSRGVTVHMVRNWTGITLGDKPYTVFPLLSVVCHSAITGSLRPFKDTVIWFPFSWPHPAMLEHVVWKQRRQAPNLMIVDIMDLQQLLCYLPWWENTLGFEVLCLDSAKVQN